MFLDVIGPGRLEERWQRRGLRSQAHCKTQETPMSLYDRDFFAWANEQAALLRAGCLAAADIENIAEEIESMGRSEKRELLSRLAILLMHILKWQAQPMLRGNSWRGTIKIQRREIARYLADNPSLTAKLPEVLSAAYGDAVFHHAVRIPRRARRASAPRDGRPGRIALDLGRATRTCRPDPTSARRPGRSRAPARAGAMPRPGPLRSAGPSRLRRLAPHATRARRRLSARASI